MLEVERLIDRLSEFPGPGMVAKTQIEEDWKLGWDGIVKEPEGAETDADSKTPCYSRNQRVRLSLVQPRSACLNLHR